MPITKQLSCNHCGTVFAEEARHCPNCDTPTPKQSELETAEIQKKFIRYFVIVMIICVIMVLWLPRDI